MIVQKQLVVFNLGNEEFGTEIEQVQQIVRLPRITKFPNTPAHVEGIINLRDNILPIFDLHKCLGLESFKKSSSARVIVINSENGRNVGIIVDSVSEIINLDQEAIDCPPSMVGKKYVKGIVKINNRLIMLLNIEEILTIEKKRRLIRTKPPERKLLLKRAKIKDS